MSLRLGQKVKLKFTGEVGVVVWTWKDEHGDDDTYVAFFGESFPTGEPTAVPGILHYFESSLEPLD
jgi:hypothetical protein